MLQHHFIFLSLLAVSVTCFAPLENGPLQSESQERLMLPIFPLTEYRSENSLQIMQANYLANKRISPTLQHVKAYTPVSFAQFENERLPLFITQLKEHENNPFYRKCFQCMLIEEIFKKITIFSSLAKDLARKRPETDEFKQQEESLFEELKTHNQAIDRILKLSEIPYDQLTHHCIQKTRICCSVTELTLSLY